MTTPPVQSTNILRLLHDHLWPEAAEVESKIAETEAHLAHLRQYRSTLAQIADAAGIAAPSAPEVP